MAREHISSQLIYLLRYGPMGRRKLVEASGLTESVVRTQLQKLQARRIVTMSKRGTSLTPKGEEEFQRLLNKVKAVEELSLKELRLDRYNLAALLRDCQVFATWRYRDLAIKEGATAAIFISCLNDDLWFTDSHQRVAEQNPQDAKIIKEIFAAREDGDLVVIVFAASRAGASKGLWRIIQTITSPSSFA